MSRLPPSLFVPGSGFRQDTRFEGEVSVTRDQTPAELAYDEGYAQGLEAATAQAQAEARELAAAQERIESTFERLSEADGLRLEERLRETVLALCQTVLATLAHDPDALTGRIHKALALLRRAEDERVLRLHPDDHALVSHRLPQGLRFEPDPSMVRGELRIETGEGGIEDGPEQWRRTLQEALSL